jgi:hypothetical protein
VGALDSDAYPSPDPGSYLVYSGVFSTRKQAAAAAKQLRKSFPDAQAVKVAATAGGASGAPVDKEPAKTQSKEELKKKESLTPAAAGRSRPRDLRERREELAHEYARLQWDLGGLAYEMAIRDHFRLDVLSRHAARLQEVDGQLGAAEQLARIDEGGAAGACPNCDALYSRGAAFCSHCGHALLRNSPSTLG